MQTQSAWKVLASDSPACGSGPPWFPWQGPGLAEGSLSPLGTQQEYCSVFLYEGHPLVLNQGYLQGGEVACLKSADLPHTGCSLEL